MPRKPKTSSAPTATQLGAVERITHTAPPSGQTAELPSERALRDFMAKAQLKNARAIMRGQRQLSIHAGADTSRRNTDWRAPTTSADLANIPDAQTLMNRARQLVRDCWIGRSIQSAYSRNVVGEKIHVIPAARDKNGKLLPKLNARLAEIFKQWSTSSDVDIEGRQTFEQKCAMAVTEFVAVGEHMVGWSYEYPQTPTGRFDASAPVGLRLQSFEPEQFDLRLISWGRPQALFDPVNGLIPGKTLPNEVRGGIEVDQNGRPTAFHMYTRTPNDYLPRPTLWSKRIPAERMLHFFLQTRVRQTRGESLLAPVLQEVRDHYRYRDAIIWRALMEACYGAKIKKNIATPTGFSNLGMTPAPGATGTTPNGTTTIDFAPGMVTELQPGEDIEFSGLTTPSGNYDAFIAASLRSIGAGTGISFGQLTRQSEGNYSSARQDMLEDWKNWKPIVALLIEKLVRPIYELVIKFAAREGRLDDIEDFDFDDFLENPNRILAATYLGPQQTWIDPQKEAAGFKILLENHLITRQEIAAMRGHTVFELVKTLAAETVEFESLGLLLPENADERESLRKIILTMAQNRLGTLDNVMINQTDTQKLWDAARFPRRDDVETPILPINITAGPIASGEIIKGKNGKPIEGGVMNPDGSPVANVVPPTAVTPGAAKGRASPSAGNSPNGNGAPQPPPSNGENGNGNGKSLRAAIESAGRLAQLLGSTPIDGVGESIISPISGADRETYPAGRPVLALPVIPHGYTQPPRYRWATDVEFSCQTCSYSIGGHCSKFGFDFTPGAVCSAIALLPAEKARDSARALPPGPPDGDPGIDRGGNQSRPDVAGYSDISGPPNPVS